MTGPAEDAPSEVEQPPATGQPPEADQPAAPAAKRARTSSGTRKTPSGSSAAGATTRRATGSKPTSSGSRSTTGTKAARPAAAQQASDTVRNRTPKPKPAAAEAEPEAVVTEEPTPEQQPAATADGAAEEVQQANATTTLLLPVATAEPTEVFSRSDLAGGHPAPSAAEPEAPPVASRPARRAAPVLRIEGLTKRFGATLAVDAIDLTVQTGSFFGIVGPNGAGKTTTLSMITGLLRPDAGAVHVHSIDVWREPERAKRAIGVLPDALRLFDRLSGAQLLYYSGVLRGLDGATVRRRSGDLIAAFGLEDAAGRLVADYSAGMTKKIALACSMIHSPRLLVLDEPFESVDPVSAANIVEILQRYVAAGGTVVLSSHSMDLIQRVCDQVAIVIAGRVLAAGTVDEVRGEQSLEDRFVELAGGRKAVEGLEWLHSFAD